LRDPTQEGRTKKNSDVDLVLITTDKMDMVTNPSFIYEFAEVSKYQIEYYGACTSIRTLYKNGLEVEFGLVEPSWIASPLDTGTYKVLANGYKILVDKKDYFNDLKI
jgi:hypothetical protein